MAKNLRVTKEQLDSIRADFEKVLQNVNPADGKITYTKMLPSVTRKAELHFSDEAWSKMTGLIAAFDKEVAWHGVTTRDEDESKDLYIVSDIVVYPQTVTNAHVDMDETAYAKWLMDNDEDERFNHLRLQGHSHVNMGVDPSGTDLDHQRKILNMVGDDDFYIFIIANKSLARRVWIYDYKKNILFENFDVTVTYGDKELTDFIKEARSLVKQYVYTPPVYASGSYYNNSNTTPAAYKTPTDPAWNTQKPVGNPSAPIPVKATAQTAAPKEKARSKVDSSWSGYKGDADAMRYLEDFYDYYYD